MNEQLSKMDLDKLKNYQEVEFETLEVGDHFRYTSNKYQQQGRKLAYGVVKTKGFGSITVNAYQQNPEEEPMYPDWTIVHPDRNKQYIFYKKEPRVCDSCEYDGLRLCNCTKIKSYNC